MTQTPKILCISLGSIGKRHLRNARALLPDAEIALWRQYTQGVESPPDGANKILQTREEALAFAPHAVIVSSPASEHIRNALPFLERDIPLFIEKPLADRMESLEKFVEKAAISKSFTMVGYVLRFLPLLHAAKKHISDGTLGDIYTAHIQVGQYLPDWRPDSDYRHGVSAQAKLGGGALLELSHEIDYATWLFGMPKSLQCSRARLSPLEMDVEDSAHILMEYADKRIAIQLDFLQRVANMEMQIVGSKATLRADLIKEEMLMISQEYPQGVSLECEKLPNGNDIYLRQFDFFFAKALAGYKPAYPSTLEFTQWPDVANAAEVLKLVDLAKKASDTGTRQYTLFDKADAA